MASLSSYLRAAASRIALLRRPLGDVVGQNVRNPAVRKFNCSAAVLAKKETVTVNYILPDNEKVTVKAKEGQNLLDIVLDNDVDIDGYGACEGTLACSTCHLIFEQDVYDNLPEQPTDEELDMLDLAYGLTDTSRLGCQVCVTKEMDGLTVKVPESISDARTV
ncbi:adrenodoxin-like isoform X1 [Ptychodera flava]|uniref:adrenodoxin-like isoform X1 n=1 Tax=Ptychodera flava TaxID=63121 RepID=UPI00396A700C